MAEEEELASICVRSYYDLTILKLSYIDLTIVLLYSAQTLSSVVGETSFNLMIILLWL